MIWTLIRKELLANLLTFRLAVALVFTVLLSVLTTVIGSLDFSRNVEAYHKEVRKYEQALDKVTVYGQLQPQIILPPQPLGIFCRGVVRLAGWQYQVELDQPNRGPWTISGIFDSEYMKTLVQIDFVTVVSHRLSACWA